MCNAAQGGQRELGYDSPSCAVFAHRGAFFVPAMKDTPMESPDDPMNVPAPTHFAKGDTFDGDDLKRQIMASLKDRLPDLQGVHVTVFGTSVALRGKVSTKNEKRECVEYCRHVPGVMRVVNDLVVAEQKPVFLDPEEEMTASDQSQEKRTEELAKKTTPLANQVSAKRIVKSKTAVTADPAPQTRSSTSPSEEVVQVNAYLIWMAAGRPQGNGVKFWPKAEKGLSIWT